MGLVARTSEHRFGRGVEKHDVLRRVHGDDGVHRRIEDAAQARLAARELRLRVDALGNIAQDHREEFLPFLAVLRNRSLDRKFSAVGAQSLQHHLTAHAPRRRARAAEALDMRAMSFAKTLGKQLVQWLPKDRVARPAECAFGGGIEHDDMLALGDRDDRVHRGFDDVADARAQALERAIRSLALRR